MLVASSDRRPVPLVEVGDWYRDLYDPMVRLAVLLVDRREVAEGSCRTPSPDC
jgi:hypothetical protein